MKRIYLALICVALAGCGSDEFPDLRDFVKNSGAGMRGKVLPPPTIKLYEPFAYNNEMNLADPFKPRKAKTSSNGSRGANEPDMNRPKESLEEFPLESLKMVGYMLKSNVGYAIIRGADNILYQVRAGNYIGMNFGKIKRITETNMLIEEKVQDSTGDWSERNSSLQLLND
ncbi:MAG: pilus assembly protein PilP [Gallionella sp.]